MAYRHINKKSMMIYAAVMLIAYAATLFIPVGWPTYFVTLPAYLVIGLTCVARANDLVEDSNVADARRFGFSVMAGLVLMFILEPVFGTFPRWPRVFVSYALSTIWMTTANLPPWWDWVTGSWSHHTQWEKVKLFFKSLHGRTKS